MRSQGNLHLILASWSVLKYQMAIWLIGCKKADRTSEFPLQISKWFEWTRYNTKLKNNLHRFFASW